MRLKKSLCSVLILGMTLSLTACDEVLYYDEDEYYAPWGATTGPAPPSTTAYYSQDGYGDSYNYYRGNNYYYNRTYYRPYNYGNSYNRSQGYYPRGGVSGPAPPSTTRY